MILNKLFSLICVASIARALDISVSGTGGNASSPHMYGIMFEDINHSGDGGIYAELIQNRAFQGSSEFPSTLKPWVAVGNAILTLQNSATSLSKFLPTSVNVAGSGKIGLLNPGWWGIDVKPQTYNGSFWTMGKYDGVFTVKLQSALTTQVFATKDIQSMSESGEWVQHNFTLEPTVGAPNSNNTFVVEFDAGTVVQSLNFNLISLFPPTYKNRTNGLRTDIMEGLAALEPSFLRFPGGNNLEGDKSHYAWRWNETIGPLTQRPGRPGTWGYENTDGLGLVEYLDWCTDLSMDPILAVWGGMYLGGNGVLTAAQLSPWVEDTMHELEFIMGTTNSTYGALRASLGYPNPWNITYVEIGNEDDLQGGAASYASYRFKMFNDAIKAVYPHITVISSAGDLSATAVGSATDYHIYTRPDTFVKGFNHFDLADRKHPVFIGEYAMVQPNKKDTDDVDWSAPRLSWPNWIGAVSEAIWCIGAERNGDVVFAMSYAPLLQNLNSYQWTPDLISFTADPAQNIMSTSYHVIELLSSNRYDATVPVATSSSFGPAYWVAGVNEPGQYTFKAAVYNTTAPVPFNISFKGVEAGAIGNLTMLSAPAAESNNVPGGLEVVKKTTTELTAGAGGTFAFELGQYTVAVLTT